MKSAKKFVTKDRPKRKMKDKSAVFADFLLLPYRMEEESLALDLDGESCHHKIGLC